MNQLKALCISCVAIFAASAVAATAAQALEYHVESTPAGLTGESLNHVFTVTHAPLNVEVKCGTTKFSGKVEGATTHTTVTVHPEYTQCEINEAVAIANTHSCNYELLQPNASREADFNISNCPASAPITITSTGCTLKLSNQGTLGKFTYTNQGAGATRDVLATIAGRNMTVNQSTGCPGGAGTFTTGDYDGTITVKAYSNEPHTIQEGFWVA